MAKIKIGFKGLSVPDQVERGRMIKGKMTGNASFLNPNPTLVAYGQAVDALEKAYNASRGRDKNQMAIMRICRKELLEKSAILAAYVHSASNGDIETILSSGFDIVRRGPGAPEVTKVYNVRLSKARADGSLKVRWNKMQGAKVYLVRVLLNPSDPETAQLKATPSACFCTLSGLPRETWCYVQVAAIGGGKIGDYSDPVRKFVE